MKILYKVIIGVLFLSALYVLFAMLYLLFNDEYTEEERNVINAFEKSGYTLSNDANYSQSSQSFFKKIFSTDILFNRQKQKQRLILEKNEDGIICKYTYGFEMISCMSPNLSDKNQLYVNITGDKNLKEYNLILSSSSTLVPNTLIATCKVGKDFDYSNTVCFGQLTEYNEDVNQLFHQFEKVDVEVLQVLGNVQ